MLKFFLLAAFVACAMGKGMPYDGPVWPRAPLDFLLRAPKLKELDEKIVGGATCTANEFEFLISLQRQGALGAWSHSCGGSIYKTNIILNAAHCVNGQTAGSLRVVAGEHSLGSDSGKEQIRTVSRFTMHQSYNSRTYENDIALIFLSSNLDLSAGTAASAVTLPSAGQETAAGTTVTVAGWGTTSSGGSIPDTCRKVDLQVVSDATCNSNYGNNMIKSTMLCAAAAGKDSCQGDSGGPLFTSSRTQVGIVSWGYGCADPLYPGVYTQVSSFIDWITTNDF